MDHAAKKLANQLKRVCILKSWWCQLLGDEFDDDEKLIILPVKLTENDVNHEPDIDYERYRTIDIPASLIDFKHIIYCQ